MKKFVSTALAVILIAACVGALAACNKDVYYNKTFTFTGEHKIDWNLKNYFDNYVQDWDKETSQKAIIEKHWDKIDFSKSYTSAENVDDLIAKINNAKIFDSLKGLSFSFGSKDDLNLTLTLPTAFSDWGFGSSVTMPFAETQEQLDAIRTDWFNVDATIDGTDRMGYSGIGIKVEGDKAITVSFFFTEIGGAYFEIQCYSKTEFGHDVTHSLSVVEMRPSLKDANGNSILDVAAQPVYTLTDNK